jgi:predicted N-acetyltransferase YhbS
LIEVRTLQREDLSAVLPLAREAVPALRLDEELLDEILLRDTDAPDNLTLAACDDGQLVGVACAVIRVGESSLRESRGHVKLLATLPQRRREGIGSMLLSLLESRLVELGATTIETDGASPRYLQPGLPITATAAQALFEKNGYELIEKRVSMTASLDDLDLDASSGVETLASGGIVVRRATSSDARSVCERIQARFSSIWANEVAVSIARSRPGVHLALDAASAQLAGFACSGLWARNAFGPMGTVDEMTGRGIGGVLLSRCLLDLRQRGERNAVIPWVGPERFYQRRCGAEITLKYLVLCRDLRPVVPLRPER